MSQWTSIDLWKSHKEVSSCRPIYSITTSSQDTLMHSLCAVISPSWVFLKGHLPQPPCQHDHIYA
jgi:hypothetical protein